MRDPLVRALIFDLDNTLVPEHAYWEAAFADACGAFCAEHELSTMALRAAVFEEADTLWRASGYFEACDALGLGTPSWLLSECTELASAVAPLQALVPELRGEAWRRGLRRLGVRDPARAGELSAAFRLESPTHHLPYEDVLPALRALRLDGYRLAVLTNGMSDLQRRKLRLARLDPYFEVVAISGEIGLGKPSIAAFDYVLDRLGLAPNQAAMIGDSLDRDVAGAAAARIRAIWIDRTQNPAADTVGWFRIETLYDLAYVLLQ